VELRDHIQRPAQFAGLHYFNPVAQMPLVEIIHHDGMAPETERRLAAFCKALGKFPVPVAGSRASWSTACCSRTCWKPPPRMPKAFRAR
jgi:3-hydroxyacyl-CoA dehydrogenase